MGDAVRLPIANDAYATQYMVHIFEPLLALRCVEIMVHNMLQEIACQSHFHLVSQT